MGEASVISSDERVYFPKLDGLRFLAFLLVFVHHYPVLAGFFEPFRLHGWIGVELFFVISSYLLTKLLDQEIKQTDKILMKNYFLRRILRIWPLYFGYIFIMLFLTNFANLKMCILRLAGLLTFTDNLMTAKLNFNEYISYAGHLWTISLEQQYYIFLPFFVYFARKTRLKTILFCSAAIWLFMIIGRIISVQLELKHPFIWVLPIQADAFLFGTLLGLGVFNRVFNKINNSIKLLVGVLLLSIIFFIPNVDEIGANQVVIYIILAFGFMLVLDGILKNQQKWSNIFSSKIIRYLGKISYGLYVYHMICIAYIPKFIQNNYFFVFKDTFLYRLSICFITLILTISISALSYELYEKWFLKQKEKFTIISSRPV